MSKPEASGGMKEDVILRTALKASEVVTVRSEVANHVKHRGREGTGLF